MREAKSYVGTHEFDSRKQRTIKFKEQVEPISGGDFKYPYISKALWDHLGQPYVIRVTIEAVMPEDDDASEAQ